MRGKERYGKKWRSFLDGSRVNFQAEDSLKTFPRKPGPLPVVFFACPNQSSPFPVRIRDILVRRVQCALNKPRSAKVRTWYAKDRNKRTPTSHVALIDEQNVSSPFVAYNGYEYVLNRLCY